jgi:hypothetical protein
VVARGAGVGGSRVVHRGSGSPPRVRQEPPECRIWGRQSRGGAARASRRR